MYRCIIKQIFILILSVTAIVSLGACAHKPTTPTADYIGIDAAKDAALKAANISSNNVIFSSAGLDSRDGTFFYQVVFTENGVEHRYDIDALTGVVIAENHAPRTDDTAVDSSYIQKETTTATNPSQETTSTYQTESQQSTTKPTQGPEPTQNTTADITSIEPSSSQNTTQTIDGNAALSIALLHAGISEKDIAVSKVEDDIENGIRIFDVEFITLDGIEYDYEISTEDGSIISFDYDAEASFPKLPPKEVTDTGIITASQAKQIVIERVPGATEEIIKIELDEDDGRFEYEGSLIYDTMKYEFKIDAYSGTVIEWEADRLY